MPEKRAEWEQWKKPNPKTTLTLTSEKDPVSGRLPYRRIGGFGYGNVYLGRLHLEGDKVKRVAVKVFDNALSDQTAAKYQKVIEDLSKAGVRLPKMAMYKHPKHGWVQVSQLFFSKGKSKIVNKSNMKLNCHKDRIEAIRELTKCANAGYYPAYDLVEPFKDRQGVIPMDLDEIVRLGKFDTRTLGLQLDDHIAWLGKKGRKQEFFQAALETANPELQQELQRIRKENIETR